jgi:hypothetical protein
MGLHVPTRLYKHSTSVTLIWLMHAISSSFVLACGHNGRKEANDLFLGRRILAFVRKRHSLEPRIIEAEGGRRRCGLFPSSLLAKCLLFLLLSIPGR